MAMVTLTEESNFLAIDESVSNYEGSQIVVVSVPYEHTVSYGGGTANGPAAIIAASHQVEFYDDEYDKELCFDKGIATLEPLDLSNVYDKEMLDKVKDVIDALLMDNKFVVTLGGEHTLAIAPIKSHYKKYPNMSVLHFDAHSDLRDDYLDNKYSHACFMRRVFEFFPPQDVVQVGIRAQCIEERAFIRENGMHTYFASAINNGVHKDWRKDVVSDLKSDVYITFDVDFFDPSIMPTTGTPEPNGFLYNDAIEIFHNIKRSGKRIVGFDVVELSPAEGIHHTDVTVARLVYKLLNVAFYGN